MNRYTIDELHEGMTAEFSVTVTEEKMAQFLALTGDCNPLHNSEEHAKAKGYPGRVVYGMLCASLYSTLAGVYLPGEHCLLQQVDSKFRKPVFIGDTLTVSGTVAEVSAGLRRITVKAKIRNQNGVLVGSAEIYAGVSA
ncbi:MAG: MaoC family dehydratase [Oscillospiraceae bacterium]|nr:MaoC family dehydratase [Oscillospiraceae bacterium]